MRKTLEKEVCGINIFQALNFTLGAPCQLCKHKTILALLSLQIILL